MSGLSKNSVEEQTQVKRGEEMTQFVKILPFKKIIEPMKGDVRSVPDRRKPCQADSINGQENISEILSGEPHLTDLVCESPRASIITAGTSLIVVGDPRVSDIHRSRERGQGTTIRGAMDLPWTASGTGHPARTEPRPTIGSPTIG